MAAFIKILREWNAHPVGACVFIPEAATVAALIADGTAAATTAWTFNQFMNRFTQDERMALATAAASSPQILLWFTMGAGATIVAADPDVKAGLDAMVTAELITQERETQILDPTRTSP